MKYAEIKINEARARVVALDRNFADLTRALNRCAKADRKLIGETMAKLGQERMRAYRDYSELLELVETPAELMASA